jgi:NADH-quinone oxidoreductase subunit C
MTKEEITKIITDKFLGKIKESKIVNFEPALEAEKETILEVLKFAKESKELCFDFFSCLIGVDRMDHLEIIYLLISLEHKHKLALKASLPKENPNIETASFIWAGASWHEREIAELFGIKFLNHPDMRPLLLPEEWDEGFPLRRDWTGKDFVKLPEK